MYHETSPPPRQNTTMCSCYTISWGGLGLKCAITHGYSDSSTHIYTAYIYIYCIVSHLSFSEQGIYALTHSHTVRLTASEGTILAASAALLTTHRYIPVSLFETAVMMYEFKIAPVGISLSSFCHWYVRSTPVAVTVKVAGCPGTTNSRGSGWTVIMGGITEEGGKN